MVKELLMTSYGHDAGKTMCRRQPPFSKRPHFECRLKPNSQKKPFKFRIFFRLFFFIVFWGSASNVFSSVSSHIWSRDPQNYARLYMVPDATRFPFNPFRTMYIIYIFFLFWIFRFNVNIHNTNILTRCVCTYKII